MKLDFEKMGGLIPAIVQDYNTNKVLMLGFMNEEAYEETKATGKVTFFSRTKNRIWMKGETSGNTLQVVTIAADCDNDTLLIKAIPAGPVCHTGADTCFGEKNVEDIMFLKYLQNFIDQRRQEMLVKRKLCLPTGIFLQIAAEPIGEIPAQIRHILPFLSPEKRNAARTGIIGNHHGKTVIHGAAQQRGFSKPGMACYSNTLTVNFL